MKMSKEKIQYIFMYLVVTLLVIGVVFLFIVFSFYGNRLSKYRHDDTKKSYIEKIENINMKPEESWVEIGRAHV